MRRITIALSIGLSLGGPGPELAGQAPVAPGSIVRAYVVTPPRSPLLPMAQPALVQGAFVTMDSTHLLLVRGAADTVVLRRDAIRQFDLRGAGYRPVRKGAIVGAVLGTLAGALIGSKIREIERCEASYCFDLGGGPVYTTGEVMDTVNAVGRGIGIGAVAGGVLGALIGSRIQSYRWIPLETATPRLRVVPSGRSVGVRASLSF